MTSRLALAALLGLLVAGAPAAHATHPQPEPDITKVPYEPIGHFEPGGPVPPDYETACEEEMVPLMSGGVFNPSGTFNSFDLNVFETICLPFRNQDDESPNDPWGNGGEGEKRHGYCAGANPADPLDPGVCPNHQLEYIEHFERTMQAILGPFGVTFQRYEFEHPEGTGRNPAAIVVGSDHPEQHILIGSHYDQTTTGPASTWDSAEGHAEMVRAAKMMADYWTATGTRPAATVKFVPMDGEEDGLLGSADYVNNTLAPDSEGQVRGYWNADPCAGGYPAFHYGTANRVDMGIQIGISVDDDVNEFNAKVPSFVESVFDHVDDNLESFPGAPEIFVSTAEGPPGVGGDIGRDVFIGTDQPILFSSDWANFIALGIPFFNPGPEVTGPNSPGDEGPGLNLIGTPEALYQFHTPLDNLVTMQRYTGGGPTGMQWSEGWMKGMEFCSFMLAYGMLQPDQGGAQKRDGRVVAYYEALPNEAERGKLVTFDAGGSHQYSDPAAGTLVPVDDLQYRWDFGDGTPTAYGLQVKHAYRRTGTYTSRLTVTNRASGESATMSIPIVVESGQGTDTDPPGQDVDKLPPNRGVVACSSSTSLQSASARARGRKLAIDFATDDPVLAEVFLGRKRVAKSDRPFTFKARRKGVYAVRLTSTAKSGRQDLRSFAFELRGRKLRKRRPFTRPDSCELVSLFRLGSPSFDARRPLDIAFSTTQPAKVKVTVKRGRRTVKRYRRTTTANRAVRLRLSGRRLRRGEYTVILKAGSAKAERLYAKRT